MIWYNSAAEEDPKGIKRTMVENRFMRLEIVIENTVVGVTWFVYGAQGYTTFKWSIITIVNFIHLKYHITFPMAKFESYFLENLKIFAFNPQDVFDTNQISLVWQN